jgi:hypothetical protein
MIWVVGHAVMPVLAALRTISATVMSSASTSPIVHLFRLAILKRFTSNFPPQTPQLCIPLAFLLFASSFELLFGLSTYKTPIVNIKRPV